MFFKSVSFEIYYNLQEFVFFDPKVKVTLFWEIITLWASYDIFWKATIQVKKVLYHNRIGCHLSIKKLNCLLTISILKIYTFGKNCHIFTTFFQLQWFMEYVHYHSFTRVKKKKSIFYNFEIERKIIESLFYQEKRCDFSKSSKLLRIWLFWIKGGH